jgi:hypothetical protein
MHTIGNRFLLIALSVALLATGCSRIESKRALFDGVGADPIEPADFYISREDPEVYSLQDAKGVRWVTVNDTFSVFTHNKVWFVNTADTTIGIFWSKHLGGGRYLVQWGSFTEKGAGFVYTVCKQHADGLVEIYEPRPGQLHYWVRNSPILADIRDGITFDNTGVEDIEVLQSVMVMLDDECVRDGKEAIIDFIDFFYAEDAQLNEADSSGRYTVYKTLVPYSME